MPTSVERIGPIARIIALAGSGVFEFNGRPAEAINSWFMPGSDWVTISQNSRANWVTVQMVYKGKPTFAHIDDDGLSMLYTHEGDENSTVEVFREKPAPIKIESPEDFIGSPNAAHAFRRRAGAIIAEVERRVNTRLAAA